MNYAKQASLGMLWLSIGIVIARVSSFLSLIVLGWYLSTEEFALYALAYSSSAIFIALRNGGIQQIILQRGVRSYDLSINFYTRYAMFFNILAMLLIILVSPLIVNLYDDNILYILLWIIAISLPLGTAGLLYRSKLSIDLRFSDVARFDAYSSIVRHTAAAFFAISGLGVVSFILPLLIVAIFEGVYGKYKSGVVLLKKRQLSLHVFKSIFNSTRWMIITAIAISVTLQGDYFVIGLLENKETVGLYFFGFQVIFAIAIVISYGIQTVIMPIMSRMKNDILRQAEAFKKMLIIMVMVITPVAFQACILSGDIVSYIWAGKWDEAIPVIQLMSLSLVTHSLKSLGKSVLESHAKWEKVSLLVFIDAVGIVFFAIIGAMIGGLVAIAVAVSIFRFVYGLLYILYVSSVLGIKYTYLVRLIFYTLIPGVFSLLVVLWIKYYFNIESGWVFVSVEIVIFMSIYISMLMMLQSDNFKITKNYIYSLVLR